MRNILEKTKKGLTLQEGLEAVIIVGLIGLFMGFFALFNDKFADTAGENTSSENISVAINQEFENQTDILGLVLLAVFFGIAITALLASFLIRLMGERRV